jgi:hypothetical protein
MLCKLIHTDASIDQQRHAIESSKYLRAEKYERTENRKGHSNNFKPKIVKTLIGEITFAVPQVREGVFILLPWKRDCGVKEPSRSHWQKWLFRECPPEK